MSMIEVVFSDGSKTACANRALWQWDRLMWIIPVGITLPDSFDAHICNVGDSETTTVEGGPSGVMIPNRYLETGRDIYVFLYITTEGDPLELAEEEKGTRATWYRIRVPVKPRPRPCDI